ncbi:hypothetical protein SAMN06297382_2079 [Amphiplicatus metriothermophilus]|uniref:Uncharacterized protein n=1 Tax=Amphiplicatus metriothermophilus TaxID=1519374 RepID=A0A239PV46_9PROT|nr:hypothetical protein [Amphiplicatus metriothermophilus]SNT74171.1 hypothetical protein SAMN06297382_2079 [Amphiplicatus metriothermophilus]
MRLAGLAARAGAMAEKGFCARGAFAGRSGSEARS